MNIPTPLPTLIKRPDRKYIIGCDFALGKDRTEIFTFVVASEHDGGVYVEQEGSVQNKINEVSHIQHYIDLLEEFYNTKCIVEK